MLRALHSSLITTLCIRVPWQHTDLELPNMTTAHRPKHSKKIILMNWKDKKQLRIAHYHNSILDFISIERISASVKNQLCEFDTVWAPMINNAFS